jgi:pimeloyl-ACP methyl ester carboxylesterase
MIRRGYAETPAGQIAYIEAGSGEPLILLHLAPRSCRMFTEFLPLLAHQHRAIAIDLLGYGDSPPVPLLADGAVDIVGMAHNIVDVMDNLGLERAHLFGIHTGAHFAAQVASNWPDRCASLALFGLGMRELGEGGPNLAAQARYSNYPAPALDGTHVMALWIRWYQDVLRYWLHARLPLFDPEAPEFASRPMPFRPMTTFLRPEELTFIRRGVIDALQEQANNGDLAHTAMMKVDMVKMLNRISSPAIHLTPGSPFEHSFCQRGARVAELVQHGEHLVLPAVDEHACELAPTVVAEVLLNFLARHPLQ